MGRITEPLTLNRYNYCLGNPMNYADPSGQFITAVGGFIIGAVGGLVISGVDFAISAYETKKNGGEIDWYGGVTGILNTTISGGVGGAVFGATGNLIAAGAAGGATYGFLSSTSKVVRSGNINSNAARFIARETVKDSFVSTAGAVAFTYGMTVMEPVGIPMAVKLFTAGAGASVASTFTDAGIEDREVTDEEIIVSGIKGGLETLVVADIAAAYEYRSYVRSQKTNTSVREVTERAREKIRNERCGSDIVDLRNQTHDILTNTSQQVLAEGSIITINPNEIRYSQSSVNGSSEIIDSMKQSGWKGEPIDVVEMPDGLYTTIDNTRVVAAREVGIDVQAKIHNYNEPLPIEHIERFTTKAGVPTTWGEAIELRIGKQKASFRNANPYGSFEMENIK